MERAGAILNSTFTEIKGIHLELRNFIENLDEKWVEKNLLEWTEEKLAKEMNQSCQINNVFV